jgi:hypothetical protein
MSTQPTARQLSYLRRLAEQTGTTFSPPSTRAEASRAIRAIRERPRSSRSERQRERREVQHDMATRRGDAAQVTSSELSGWGSHATWARNGGSPQPQAQAPASPAAPARTVELGRYRTHREERVLYGQRVNGVVRITDVPSGRRGRAYLVERELEKDGYAALQALVTDYLSQAQKLGDVPMALSPVDGARHHTAGGKGR